MLILIVDTSLACNTQDMSSSLFSVMPGDGGDSDDALLTNAVVGLGATTLLLLLSTTAYFYYNKSSSSAYKYNNDMKKIKNGKKSKSDNADENYPKLDRAVSETKGVAPRHHQNDHLVHISNILVSFIIHTHTHFFSLRCNCTPNKYIRNIPEDI